MDLELNESEYTALILAATRDKVLQCDFGGGRIWLRGTPSNQWAVDMIGSMRHIEEPFCDMAQEKT